MSCLRDLTMSGATNLRMLLTVSFAPVTNAQSGYLTCGIVNFINDSVVALAGTIHMCRPAELFQTLGTRIDSTARNFVVGTSEIVFRKTAKFFHSRRNNWCFRHVPSVFFSAAVTLLLVPGISFAAKEAKAAAVEATVPTAAVATPAAPALPPAATAKTAAPLVSVPVKLVSKETAKPITALEPSGVVTKTVYGQVGLKNDNGFSLVLERDEEGGVLRELWFPFGSTMSLRGYESVDNLRDGDLVSVTFDEVVDVRERILKKIGLERANRKAQEKEKAKLEPPAEVVSVSFLRDQKEAAAKQTEAGVKVEEEIQ